MGAGHDLHQPEPYLIVRELGDVGLQAGDCGIEARRRIDFGEILLPVLVGAQGVHKHLYILLPLSLAVGSLARLRLY